MTYASPLIYSSDEYVCMFEIYIYVYVYVYCKHYVCRMINQNWMTKTLFSAQDRAHTVKSILIYHRIDYESKWYDLNVLIIVLEQAIHIHNCICIVFILKGLLENKKYAGFKPPFRSKH